MLSINYDWRFVVLTSLISGLLLVSSSNAGEATEARFDNYFPEDGLPGRTVWASHEDSFGFRWTGGTNGLSRFDGERFERFPFPETQGELPVGVTVLDFAIAPDNTIWVGTQSHGLFRVQPYAHNNQLSSIQAVPSDGAKVQSVVVTSSGVFAGTSKGLESWDPSTRRFHVLDVDEFALKTMIFEVYAATETLLLIGSGIGLYLYDVESATVTPIAVEIFSKHLVLSIEQIGENTFLAGTHQGVVQFNIDGSRVELKSWFDKPTVVFSIASYKDDIWLGTNGQGLILVTDGEIVQQYSNNPRIPATISSAVVNAVEVDKSGVLWASTLPGGFHRLDTNALHFGWRVAGSPGFECVNDSVIRSFLKVADSTWIGTVEGLARTVPSTGQCEYTGDQAVYGMLQTANGEIWAASTAGPIRINRTGGQLGFAAATLDHITYFIVDTDDGALLAGTSMGLFRVDTSTGNARPVHLTDGNQPSVHAASIDSDGAVWLATDAGLFRWTSQSGASAVELAGIENEMHIKAILYARSKLWLGIREEGLVEADTLSLIAKVRIPPEAVGEILGLVDDGEDLWITTETGITRFTPRLGTLTRYEERDGLQSNVFTEWAVLRDAQGNIYLGGTRGWNVFHPQDIRPNPVPPKVALTGLTLSNEPVPIDSSDDDLFSLPSSMELLDSLSLTHNQDTIGIEFAALHFADPSRNTVEYRLDGFEDKWSTARSGQRVATYTNLPWGDFTFRVRAANKDGIWGEEAALPITIITPVWARWWAIGVYIAFAFVLAWAYAQYRSAAANRRAEQLESTVNERTRELAERNQRVQEQKATIEHLLSRKNSLFANVSHEFRTPLTLILGPLDQLIEKAKNSSEQKPMFQRLRRNANRLLNLVDQLLFLARTTGSHYQTRETLRLDECVEYLMSSFQPLAEEKNLQLITTKCHAASVLANKDAVESMVSNLLSNAIKYTPAEGQIMVSLERLADTVKLSVSDTGRGLSISEQTTIFERFTRLDEDRSVEGTGIGLALVRELAEAHEGDIEVESVIGEGTTFTLVLPLTAAATPVQEQIEAPKPDHEAPLSSASRQNVLIIDDDRDMLEYVAECLEQDFHCTVASNGREGLELALELVPDVIVSDVMMPEVDGYELSRAIREDERLSHIPIILLSARGSRKSRIDGWNAYADDYVVKPFDHNELRARLHSLLKVRELLRTKVHGELVEHGKPTGLNKKEQAFVDRLDTILERRFSEIGLSRTDLASDMAVSDRQLQRKLKALIDQNPSDYLREFRLRKAKGLLSQGEQVALAAEYCGFASPSQFGHAFRQRFGITPKKFQMGGSSCM